MKLNRKVIQDAAIGVGVTDTPDGLSSLHRPGCAATIWRRQPLAGFQSWLNAVDPECLPRARVTLQANQVRNAVHQICETCGTPDCGKRTRLIEDIAALANIFSGLMDTTHIRLRLDVVTNNLCGMFHVDAVTARLICTYRGPGTQYGVSTDGAEPKRVFSVPTGSPILLKGTRWADGPPSGLLHRSPPIMGTGETRLLLVLDPVVEPEEKPNRIYLH